MSWVDVWQGAVGQKVWILPESTRQSFFPHRRPTFLSSRNAATYEDSILLGVAVGPRGNPWDTPFLRGPFGFMRVINGWRNLTRNPVCFFGEAATHCRFPNLQAVARNVMGRCVAGGSRPKGVDFARIDPPEFFSAPAAHLSIEQKRSYLRRFNLIGGRRGAPRKPVGYPVFTGTLWIHARY